MDSEKSDKSNGVKFGLFIFECVMALFYVAFGIIFLFTHIFDRVMSGGFRIACGIVFGLYGLYRVYVAYKKITQRNE